MQFRFKMEEQVDLEREKEEVEKIKTEYPQWTDKEVLLQTKLLWVLDNADRFPYTTDKILKFAEQQPVVKDWIRFHPVVMERRHQSE